jgi:hypothetical protein
MAPPEPNAALERVRAKLSSPEAVAALERTRAKFSAEEREAIVERERRFNIELAAATTPEQARRVAERHWQQAVARSRAARRVAAARKLAPAARRPCGHVPRHGQNSRTRGSRRSSAPSRGDPDPEPEPHHHLALWARRAAV